MADPILKKKWEMESKSKISNKFIFNFILSFKNK